MALPAGDPPLEPAGRHRTQQVRQHQPDADDFRQLRARLNASGIPRLFIQDQPANQLALRLVALRRQSLEGPQLALVQLCANVMHAVRCPLRRLCRKVRFVKDRQRFTPLWSLISARFPGFPLGTPHALTHRRRSLGFRVAPGFLA